MLQEICPMKFENTYASRQPQVSDVIFLFNADRVCCRFDGSVVVFPRFEEFDTLCPDKCQYLFSIDAVAYFLANETAPKGYEWHDCSISRTASPRHLAFALVTAHDLYRFYETRAYCGRCGSKSVHGELERSLVCPRCKNVEYPKISPVVIVGVLHGDSLLMVQSKNHPVGRYSLVAGFCEVGETLEQAVAREVFEETGLRVKNLHYYKSQPWGFSSSLLAGFFCELDGSPQITIDEGELRAATWLTRAEIPQRSEDISLTWEMIELFRSGVDCIKRI